MIYIDKKLFMYKCLRDNLYRIQHDIVYYSLYLLNVYFG